MTGVSTSADDLLESALELPREERARIAAELLASLAGTPDEGVEAAWDAELERRIEQVDQGEVQLLDWNDVKDRIALALKRR
jgi:putative addiction module component (TIGR02574 family)